MLTREIRVYKLPTFSVKERVPVSRESEEISSSPIEEVAVVSDQRPVIEEPVIIHKQIDSDSTQPAHKGLDIGTNMIVAASMDEVGSAIFPV